MPSDTVLLLHNDSSTRGATAPISNMRKYSKLLLVAVTSISLVAFIFYKTQYDKLYNVLQVLEFFGSADGPAGTPLLCPLHAAPAVARPTAFQVGGAGAAAVYSAFCGGSGSGMTDEGPCPRVAVLGAVKGQDRDKIMKNVRCKLWYDSSVKSLEGMASFVVEDKESLKVTGDDFKPMRFYCESKFTAKIPFGIVLIWDNKEETYLPISDTTAQLSSLHPPPSPGSLALCILPPPTLSDSTYPALESLLIHSYFGVKTFLFYDRGLTNRFLRSASDASAKDPLLNVHLLPWNPPSGLSPAVAEYLMREDCFLRTRGMYESAGALRTGQVLVPGGGARTVPEALTKYREKAPPVLHIDVLAFCSELQADSESSKNTFQLTALEQTSYSEAQSSSGAFSLAHISSGSSEPVSVDKSVLLVADYASCGTFDFPDTDVKKDVGVFSRRDSVQEKIGDFFPHKNV